MYILPWIITVVLFTIIIYQFFSNKKEAKDFTQQELEITERLHQKEIIGLQQIDDKIQKEKDKKNAELNILQDELTTTKVELENYKINQQTTVEHELALYREEQLNKIRQEFITLDLQQQQQIKDKQKAYQQAADQETQDVNKAIEHLRAHLTELKNARDSTLAIIKEEEKIKNELDFYRITLSIEDIEDIKQLQSIEKYLHNKDVLRKLIYKTFIETPMNSLFGRLGIKDAPGVYKITNIKNKLTYIGQSTNVKNRLKAHIQASLGISTIAAQSVHDAMAQEGLENFTFQLIEECDKTQLNDREKYFINYYESNTYGYNKTSGGARL